MEHNPIRISLHRGFSRSARIYPAMAMLVGWTWLTPFLAMGICSVLGWGEYADRVEPVIMVMPFALICVRFLPELCEYVSLEPEGICVTRFGKTVYAVKAEEIRLICVVGNDTSQDLCVSPVSLEELSARQEERLRNSLFRKSGVSFEKTLPRWQERFAHEYLNRLRRSLFGGGEVGQFLFLPMDSAVKELLRHLYPQACYVNILPRTVGTYDGIGADAVPVFSTTEPQQYSAEVKEDGIHILRKGAPCWIFPAENIRTVACVDRYINDDKIGKGQLSLLVITAMTVDEMAARDNTGLIQEEGSLADFPWGREILAGACCLAMASVWRGHEGQVCVMYRTEQRIRQLKTRYPHARWVDLSG